MNVKSDIVGVLIVWSPIGAVETSPYCFYSNDTIEQITSSKYMKSLKMILGSDFALEYH